MLAWEKKLELKAARAAYFCIACGNFGHYPFECPREMPSQIDMNAEKRRKRRLLIALGIFAAVCILFGMWLESQWWWAL